MLHFLPRLLAPLGGSSGKNQALPTGAPPPRHFATQTARENLLGIFLNSPFPGHTPDQSNATLQGGASTFGHISYPRVIENQLFLETVLLWSWGQHWGVAGVPEGLIEKEAKEPPEPQNFSRIVKSGKLPSCQDSPVTDVRSPKHRPESSPPRGQGPAACGWTHWWWRRPTSQCRPRSGGWAFWFGDGVSSRGRS